MGLSPGLHRVTFPDGGQNREGWGGGEKVISQKAMAPGDVKKYKRMRKTMIVEWPPQCVVCPVE